ncbi:YihY/virulence factor BrkB family protein [Bacteroides sp. 519]|uniref:YihY/virulence factor BrkB family protein n=1 Tax=Bacteroides sp. 519 TaxID=2302937 RepID=UPI0013D19AE7|nr:YihY/virulence factor BrkB family protein [Bacteroides sp. 519]NDV58275.1 YihY/virulence factor BrkB family protein [Bacteroides sp. 519]
MINKIKRFWNFITEDIWRVTEGEVTQNRFFLYTALKSIYLTADRFASDRIGQRASALTYSTLLAIVPILAILFAIARGFGFENLVRNQLDGFMGGVNENTGTILQFVDDYLKQAQSGVFVGIGLVMLLWTVLNLTDNIESIFNHIWQVKKQRSMYRKITDYFSMFLLLPILLVLSGGVSIFTSTILKEMESYILLGSFMRFLVKLIPFILVWFMFTGLYIFMPNTKVKFMPAFISGVLAGTIFQTFQFLYINGQIWVTKYNAIYGSFAAIPLLLLWLQMSWTICLIGVELTYSIQNVHAYSFDKDTRNISRRFRDFISILIMSLIAKRFENNEPPYSAEVISEQYQIPISLTNQVLFQLQEINLVHEVMSDEKSDDITYQPSMDINKLNVAVLLERLDSYGSEDFKIDTENEFKDEWKVLLDIRDDYYGKASNVLLKDL